jgi:curved DNA-binding protein
MRSAGGERTLSVTVPAGILDGQKLRLAGQGEGTQDGQPGDLYLVVRHRPHARFRLVGRDLHTRIDVSPPVAVLGGRARLQTLDRQVVARVPPGSSSGTRIRLKGQGFPAGDGGLRGDLYAEVRIAVPHRLTPEERSLYERLARLQADELANTRTNR